MNKRYQVFVSSTYDDLKEERNRVIQALLNINCIPCGMEYFPAADEDAWHCIERLIPECDYYILILAGMYGSIPSGKQKSYTHLEYELAVKHKIPVLGLLHRDPLQLPAGRCERLPARRRKLERFREQVARKLCRFWQTPDQLPGELLASLTLQIDRFPRTGWVRADAVAADDAKDEIIKLQRRLETQTKILEEFQERERSEESQLASGDEELTLCGTLRYDVGLFEVSSTWNLLLKFIRSRLGTRWSEGDLEDALLTEFKADLKSQERISLYGIDLKEGEIDKIIVQYGALGLIRQRGTIWELSAKGDRKSTRLNSSHTQKSRMPSSA